MKYFINDINFCEDVPPQKYWSFPSSYKKNKKIEIKEMIFSDNYIGSEKKDGAFYKFLKDEDGNMFLFGRNKSVSGEYLNKIELVPQFYDFFYNLPNGTCLIGELYYPNNPGSNKVTSIMNCLVDKAIKRQENNPLHYYIFDILAYNNNSYLKEEITTRIKNLKNNIQDTYKNNYVEVASYLTGKKLWCMLQEILSSGGEGIVMTKIGTCYQPGKRPARQTVKVKKELVETIDVFFTGRCTAPKREYTGKMIENWKYWYDTRMEKKIEENGQNLFKRYLQGDTIIPVTKSFFFNLAGSLEYGVYKDNKIIPLGLLSGLPEEVRANYQNYKGKVFEMTAMEITEDKAFRHGKFLQWREDLNPEDCTYEKIFTE